MPQVQSLLIRIGPHLPRSAENSANDLRAKIRGISWKPSSNGWRRLDILSGFWWTSFFYPGFYFIFSDKSLRFERFSNIKSGEKNTYLDHDFNSFRILEISRVWDVSWCEFQLFLTCFFSPWDFRGIISERMIALCNGQKFSFSDVELLGLQI